MKKLILSIETSCDETGVALVEAHSTGSGQASGGLKSLKFKVLKNLVASQIKTHAPFGGVVPNLAKREHLKNLPILFKKIGGEKIIKKINLIAVTVGPGLEPALWTGITFAKQTYNLERKTNRKLKLVGANHLEGHLYSFLLPQIKSKEQIANSKSIFPAVALIVSGGHTILLLVKDLKTWKVLGETRDDAVGEAYDKVARLLRLPYPGGPQIEKLALRQAQGKHPKGTIEFPRPMIHDNSPAGKYDFSFSGLKTSVLYFLQNAELRRPNADLRRQIPRSSALNPRESAFRADVAASFQAAAVEVLIKKTMRAVHEFGARAVILSGGVAANQFLRAELKKESRKFGVGFLAADKKYNTDNAVMIAAAGYMAYLRKKKYPLRANGNLGI